MIDAMNPNQALGLLKAGEAGVQCWNENHGLIQAIHPNIFAGQNLSGLDLRRVNLSGFTTSSLIMTDSDLRGAFLLGTHFNGAMLKNSNLGEANLTGSVFRGGDLYNTDFAGANLTSAAFIGPQMVGANFAGAIFNATVIVLLSRHFGLSHCRGLADAIHRGPSYIGLDTLRNLEPNEPCENFLLGCGLRSDEIDMVLYRSVDPIELHTCFLSYSHADESFACELYDRLRRKKVRIWKWDIDARLGRSLWGEIDEAIRIYDKLLIVASKSSLTSPQVLREMERALRREDETGKQVLFPIRIDDFIFDQWDHERRADVIRYLIGDATAWQEDRASLDGLVQKIVRDLKRED